MAQKVRKIRDNSHVCIWLLQLMIISNHSTTAHVFNSIEFIGIVLHIETEQSDISFIAFVASVK